MNQAQEKITKLVDLIGFKEARVTFDEEHHRILVLTEEEITEPQTASMLSALEHIFNLILKKENLPNFVVDVNYYRKERERLILELAKAAARKAMLTKAEVELPPMNAYERRLVHVEITTHPELKTESIGDGRDRHIVIKKLSV